MPQPQPVHKLLLVFLFLLCTGYCRAQNDATTINPDKAYYWGGFHVGGGTYTFNSGIDGSLLLRDKFMISIRASQNGNNFLFNNSYQNIEADEYALMIGGKLMHHKYNSWVLMGGISAVQVTTRGDYIGYNSSYLFSAFASPYGDNKIVNCVGVPVILKYLVAPTGFMTFDFSASANFNAQRSFVALTFGLAFGKVREGGPAAPPGRN